MDPGSGCDAAAQSAPGAVHRRPQCNAKSHADLHFLAHVQEPLSLEGYLALERALDPGSSCEAQHIAHKALYDAVNETILGLYKAANRVQVWNSK